jgi:DNA-binding beta-propeller fold protein YncE
MKKHALLIPNLFLLILCISCNYSNSISLKFIKTGEIGEYGTELPGKFRYPQGMAIGPDNSIQIVDNTNKRIQVFNDESLEYIRQYSGDYFYPISIAIDTNGKSFVTEYGDNVFVFDNSGSPITNFSTKASGDRPFPYGISIDPKSHYVIVANNPTENSRISVWTQTGDLVKYWLSPKVYNLWVSSESKIYAACWDKIIVYDIEGNILRQIATEYSVISITGDNDNHLFVTYYYYNMVQAYDQSNGDLLGEYMLPAGENPPQPYSGNFFCIVCSGKYVFVTDRVNHKIIRLSINV